MFDSLVTSIVGGIEQLIPLPTLYSSGTKAGLLVALLAYGYYRVTKHRAARLSKDLIIEKHKNEVLEYERTAAELRKRLDELDEARRRALIDYNDSDKPSDWRPSNDSEKM